MKPLPLRALEWSLIAAVAAFTFLHLSPATVDPDLWGHVLFGYRILEQGAVERADPFSWTAANQPWINHETLAEAALALAHKTAGGAGILLLKIVAGFLAMGIALALGAEERTRAARLTTWAVGAVCAVEIGFGFAARPQIFTAVLLTALLSLLRLALADRVRWPWLLTLAALFALWFNTHGGALMGLAMLAAAALVAAASRRLPPDAPTARWLPAAPRPVVVGLCAATALGLAASLCTPWGVRLPVWLGRSVLWPRPEIAEWNPTPLSWDHAVFHFVALAWILTALASRRLKRPWEIVMGAVLLAAAYRHVRHTPLFCLFAVATLPALLLDGGRRILDRCPRLVAAARNPSVVSICAAALWVLAAAAVATAFRRDLRPFTMRIPVSEYPVHAVRYIEQAGLRGNLLVYFDWGELCLWALPQCRVSLDGRLDTCYPRRVIDAHWRFYATGRAPTADLDLTQADLALLRTDLPGTAAMAADPAWAVVYRSPLATVLAKVRDGNPAPGSPVATHDTEGRAPDSVPFPDTVPALAHRPGFTP